jgi:ubiquinone/menaquinone biosynthesis C-methylase UbiE
VVEGCYLGEEDSEDAVAPMLSHRESRAVYDRIGARQDWQAFYEGPATADLVAHLALDQAHAVLEFGCGTGALAAALLRDRLSDGCRYLALDSSPVMARLAAEKLAPWGTRAEVRLTDGLLVIEAADGSFDRLLSTYVLDLLSEHDIALLLAEAHRVLAPDGRLGLVGLTWGRGWLSALVSRLWSGLHRLDARLVGGCRPIEAAGYLSPAQWRLEYRNLVSPWGVSSEIVVARRLVAAD